MGVLIRAATCPGVPWTARERLRSHRPPFHDGRASEAGVAAGEPAKARGWATKGGEGGPWLRVGALSLGLEFVHGYEARIVESPCKVA